MKALLLLAALNADQIVTVKPPADATAVEWIRLAYDTCAFPGANPPVTCSPGVRVDIKACAKDSTGVHVDCGVVARQYTLAAVSAVTVGAAYTTALNAWKADKGY